jgi:transposase
LTVARLSTVDQLVRDNLLVAKGYRPVARDQEFLLPPNMIDWLDADHLVWFVIDTVAVLDTSTLHSRAALRRDGQPARGAAGRAGYDPDMLLTLLIYAYACGERSSRRIERLCHTDVAFRLICAADVPDHTVIARFRQIHEGVFAELFTQVLRLCRMVGLARLGTIAIDGSKIAANASKDANHGEEWLREQAEKMAADTAADTAADPAAESVTGPDTGPDTGAAAAAAGGGERGVVDEILTEAGVVDAAEDALFDTARGDELPAGLADRGGRRERLARALDRIAEQKAAQQAERAAAAAARVARAEADLRAAEQARDRARDRQQAKIDTWEQAWEQAIAARGRVPHGQGPCTVDSAATVRKATARVDRAQDRLAALQPATTEPTTNGKPTSSDDQDTKNGQNGQKSKDGKEQPPRANLTDPDSRLMPTRNGWLQAYNFQFAVSADQVILVLDVTDQTNDVTSCQPMMATAADTAAELAQLPTSTGPSDTAPPRPLTQHNQDHSTEPDSAGPDSVEPVFLFDAGYASDENLTAPGPDRLIALGKTHSVAAAARDNPASGAPPPNISARKAMDHRLRTPEGAALYLRRGATVEPGIGNFKKILGRLSRRGREAALSEGHLAGIAFNLLKIHRAAPA